jgi:Flp pilus assembly secretin CpaC
MMTTNKLTKTFASGSLAIGVLAGSVLTATSAFALTMGSVTLTWDQWTSGTPLDLGDKIVKFVSGNIGADPDDKVMLAFVGDEYDFVYDAMPGASPANPNSGSFTYTIEITKPGAYFTGVALDSDVTATYNNVTKFVAEPNITLISTNGSSDPLSGFKPIPNHYTKLTVTDTITANPGEALFSLNNAFKQSVPEPGTILGLLAVGGLGLVSRFKKQK